jgi:hypothetical protein
VHHAIWLTAIDVSHEPDPMGQRGGCSSVPTCRTKYVPEQPHVRYSAIKILPNRRSTVEPTTDPELPGTLLSDRTAANPLHAATTPSPDAMKPGDCLRRYQLGETEIYVVPIKLRPGIQKPIISLCRLPRRHCPLSRR